MKLNSTLTDKQRHAKKIAVYVNAVEKVGFRKVEDQIGGVAANKFELAKDAHSRGQSEVIVSEFLSAAQETAEENLGIGCDEIDCYDALKSF